MIKRSFLISIVLLISSCGAVTKYSYTFDKGKSLDFSTGKWILNNHYSNRDIDGLEAIAFEGFASILKDSLFLIQDLRGQYLIKEKLPHKPSVNDFEDLRIGCADCDYLINYSIQIISDNLGSPSAPPHIGTVIKTNESLVEISIYDIQSLELISRTSILGTADLEISSDDTGWDFSDSASMISRKALRKLIDQYDRNKK
ncbi:MAG TPA: hypothetical protein VKZ98_03540 [Aquaticitalea sp.]|nr:hypothetical protein [Aquaticitalea sp.]